MSDSVELKFSVVAHRMLIRDGVPWIDETITGVLLHKGVI